MKPDLIPEKPLIDLLNADDIVGVEKAIGDIAAGNTDTAKLTLRFNDLPSGENAFAVELYAIAGSDGRIGMVVQGSGVSAVDSESDPALKGDPIADLLDSQTKMGIIIFQNDRVVYANRAAALIMEYSEAELRSKSYDRIAQIVHEQDRPFVMEQAHRKQHEEKGDVVHRYTYRIYTKSGKLRWLDQYSAACRYDGKMADFITFIDITEQKRIDGYYGKGQARYRELADLLPQAYYEMDLTGTIQYINSYGLRLCGYTREDIAAGLCAYDIMVFEDRERILSDVSKVLRGEHIDKHEYRLQHRNGQVLSVLIYSAPIIEDNRPVGLWGLVADITETKKVEELLRISEERYALATSVGRIGVWDLDLITNEFYLDPGIKAILGYRDDEIPNDLTSWDKHIYPDDLDDVMAAIKAHVDGETSEYVHEQRMIHKDGSVRWVFSRGQAIRDRDGTAIRLVGTDMDITARREAEAALRKSEEKYHNLFEFSQGAVIIVSYDGVILDCNNAALKFTGAVKSDIIGRPFYGHDLFQVDDISRYLNILRQLADGNDIGPFEAKVYIKEQPHWLEILPSHLADYNGKPAIQIVARNITSSKLTELTLKEVESRFTEVLENSRDVMYRLNLETETYDYVSRAVIDMLGYTPEEIIAGGLGLMRTLVPQDDLKRQALHRRHILASQLDEPVSTTTEYRIREKRGTYRWLSDSHVVLRDVAGVPRYIIGSVRDITAQKMSEEVLRNREEHWRSLLDTANSLIFCLDKDAHITVFNKECERVTGYLQEEVLGRKWQALFLPADHPHHRLKSFAEWVRQHPSDQYEGPVKTKSGEIRTILWSTSAIFSADSDELTALAVGHDITEYKAALEALGESEERYRELTNLLPQTVFEVDLDLHFTLTNKHGFEFSGYSQNDIDRGISVFDVVVKEDHQRLRDNLERLFKGESRDDHGYRMITRDGRIVPVLIYSSVIYRNGHPAGLRGVLIDITDRIRAEEALALSEERYRTLVEDMPALMCRFDADGILTYVNSAYCRYFQKSPERLIGHNFFQFIPEQERDRLQEQLRQLSPQRPNLVSEHRVLLSNGEVRWQEWRNRVLLDDANQVIGFQSVGIDITDRKRAEEILRESEEKYRILVENAAQAIFTINVNGTFLYFNEVAARYLGGRAEDFVGKNMAELFHPTDAEFQMKYLRESISSGRRIVTESRVSFPMGTRWFKTIIQPIQSRKDDIASALLLAEDITERKTNELRNTARLQLLDRLRTITNLNDLLATCCLVLRETGFYNRSAFVKLDKNGKVTNRGDVGYDSGSDRLIARLMKGLMMRVVGTQGGEKCRIRKSYLITGSMLRQEAERGQRQRGKETSAVEEPGFRLFVPVINEENRYDGWLMVEGGPDQESPGNDDVVFLEELVEIVAKDLRRIEWVGQLNRERVALREKNIALKEVLEHIEEEKQSIKQEVAKNVDQNILPALKKAMKPDGTVNKRLLGFVIDGLESLASVSGGLMRLQARLSPREVEICNLIKSGLSSQEIADTLFVTVATVKKHRETIRKKFDISNKKINLASFLKDI
ncbi:MAG: PAS domain S-box protein [candidate division Zixibacteria bacterium]|nr:PAS domain S-box protein [candidate division Zixibacteria bacterium]